MRVRVLLLALGLGLAAPAPAQEDDGGGFLERLIESNLSDAGREVRIEGFAGALSSRATLERMTIADDAGVWLILTDAALDWDRAALLRGHLEVNELVAGAIIVTRPPQPPEGFSPPPAAAPGFALPDLPVAVNIRALRAERLELGAPVLGQAAVVTLDAALALDGQTGLVRLDLERIDGREGTIALGAGIDRESGQARLDLTAREGAGGIVAGLAGIPGAPALALTLSGLGPADDFNASLRLASDGQERLAGTLRLAGDGDGGLGITADLGGDIAPLLLPEYAAFFGPDMALRLEARRAADGALTIEEFEARAAAVTLAGSAAIAADGLPERAMLEARVSDPAGGAVLLPLPGSPVRVGAADLALTLDAGAWTLDATLDALDAAAADVALARVTGRGNLGRGPQRVAGRVEAALEGLSPADPGLAQALGPAVRAEAEIDWEAGRTTALPRLTLSAEGLEAEALGLSLGGIVTGGRLSAEAITARIDDLARLSGLAGRPLAGAGTLRASGTYAPLSGIGEVELELAADGLGLGLGAADALLAGRSRLVVSATRDEGGTTLREAALTAAGFSASASGRIAPDGADLEARLAFDDLGLLGAPWGGRLVAEARLSGPPGAERLSATAEAEGLRTGTPVDGLLAGPARIAVEALRDGDGLVVERGTLEAGPLGVAARGRVAPEAALTADIALSDLAALVPGFAGRLGARAEVSGPYATARLVLDATAEGLRTGTPADGLLEGPVRIVLEGQRDGDGLEVERGTLAAGPLGVAAQGRVAPEAATLTADVTLDDLAALVPTMAGRLGARAEVSGPYATARLVLDATAEGLRTGTAVDGLLTGPLRLSAEAVRDGAGLRLGAVRIDGPALAATASGRLEAGASDLAVTLGLPDLGALAPGLGGTLGAEARVREADGARLAEVTATAEGVRSGVAQADALLAGEVTLAASLRQEGAVLHLDRFDLAAPRLSAEASGTRAADGGLSAEISARLADLGVIVDGLAGPLAVDATLADDPAGTRVQATAAGPGGIAAEIAGTLAPGFATADLAATGRLPLAALNRLAAPAVLEGTAGFDLRLSGAPGLGALSGRIATEGARLALPPPANLTLEGVTLAATLDGGRAGIEANARVAAGGTLALSGPVTLATPYSADLRLTLDSAVLGDGRLVTTRAWADLVLAGPLTGGATLSGSVQLGDTEIRIPSSGFGTGGGDIDGLAHVNEPAAVRTTRDRAGFIAREGGGTSGDGPAFGLDITVTAPDRIFVRGRGLDAQFGGELRLTGTTAAIEPVGALDLVRGRLDLLGRRLTLDQGAVLMQGSPVPFVRLSATTTADDIAATIAVEGPATGPEFRFSSVPERPEEEVLAQVLFGRNVSNLSAFQALQLASAVATLAGRGGEGIVGRLREGTGLDDLDVTTDADGTTGVRAGKFIGRNLYTDVTVDSTGKSEINLNFDVTPSLTARGRVGSDGSTGLGLYFERDY